MISGYRFDEIARYLAQLGYERSGETEFTLIFRAGDRFFTIRRPNELGSLPEPVVVDAFDAAGLPPPPPATDYVD